MFCCTAERLLVPGLPQLAQALVVLVGVVVFREQNLREDPPPTRVQRVAQVHLQPVAQIIHFGLGYLRWAEEHRPHPDRLLGKHRQAGLQVRVDRAQLLVDGLEVLEGEEPGPAAVLPAQSVQLLQVQAVQRGGPGIGADGRCCRFDPSLEFDRTCFSRHRRLGLHRSPSGSSTRRAPAGHLIPDRTFGPFCFVSILTSRLHQQQRVPAEASPLHRSVVTRNRKFTLHFVPGHDEDEFMLLLLLERVGADGYPARLQVILHREGHVCLKRDGTSRWFGDRDAAQ